ncbi:hypothetical protein FQR65_LT11089 [Abscondita terminalis]|nr:hypothetical protein FQR65_LT11089 [Abscondita terminalis]
MKKETEAYLGDWALFRDKENLSAKIGQLLSFSYLHGKTLAQRKYIKLSASVVENSIGVLCMWYTYDLDEEFDHLVPEQENCYSVIPINSYICTLPDLFYGTDGLIHLNPNIFNDIDEVEICDLLLVEKLTKRSTNVKVGLYVLVEFLTKKSKKYYVGIVTSVINREECQVKFLRQAGVKTYIFPSVDDISVIETQQITLRLKEPTKDNRSHYLFHEDLSFFNVN